MGNEKSFYPQAGAIPLKDDLVCLITSSDGLRWIFPKGRIEPGQTPQECALQESWEEAGLTGKIISDSVGTYRYQKWESHFEVTFFLMETTTIAEEWPEQLQRERKWVSVEEALGLIVDDQLRGIVRNAFRS